MSEWQPISSAPKNKTVIAFRSGIRFMRQDDLGQWRNMMHAPRETPTHWMPLPNPPVTK